LSICSSGLDASCLGQPVTIDVLPTHPLIQLAQVIPWPALAELMAKLAEAKINVTACDAVAAGEGHYGAILWVKLGDVQKAARVLGASK
jgi:hypothetical protein